MKFHASAQEGLSRRVGAASSESHGRYHNSRCAPTLCGGGRHEIIKQTYGFKKGKL